MRAAWLIAAALLASSCAKGGAGGLDPARVESRMREGKRLLARFQGAEAREVFTGLDAERRKSGEGPSCEARYGALLADIQIALAQANPALVAILEEQFRPVSAGAPSADAAIERAATAAEPALREIAAYAAEITAVPGCTFSIGVDPDEAAEGLAFVMNVLDAEKPVAQIVLQSRFDDVEAALIGAVVNAILAALDVALAHDLNWEADPAKVARQLGVTEACLRQGYIPCYLSGQAPGHPPAHLLDWAFILADNPKLGAASPRWPERMPRVAGEGAAAVLPMRGIFDAMLARSRRIYGTDVRESDFLVVYRDRDGNDRVNTADELGLNVADLKLDCTKLVGVVVAADEAEACARRFDEYEDIARAALLFIKSAASPSESVVQELEVLFDRLYGQLHAVDAGGATEAIPFDSLSGLFSEMFPVLDTAAPNFVAFDVAPYLRKPAPIRDYLPVWTKTSGPTGARFVADADDYAALVTPPASINAVDAYLDETYGPLVANLLGRGLPEVFDAAAVTERALFDCPDGARCVPMDCLNASNLFTDIPAASPVGGAKRRFRWPVLYLWLPDPAFGGVVQVDGGVWALDPALGNGADRWGATACAVTPGMRAPDNLSLQRSAWLFADFFFDHFAFAGIVGNLLAE